MADMLNRNMNSLSTLQQKKFDAMLIAVSILLAASAVFLSISRPRNQEDSTKRISKESVPATTLSGAALACVPTQQSHFHGALRISLSCSLRLTDQTSLWNGQTTVLILGGLQRQVSPSLSESCRGCGLGTGSKAICEKDWERWHRFGTQVLRG